MLIVQHGHDLGDWAVSGSAQGVSVFPWIAPCPQPVKAASRPKGLALTGWGQGARILQLVFAKKNIINELDGYSLLAEPEDLTVGINKFFLAKTT